jgi:transaldolase
VASAKDLHAKVDRPNVYIKIPATVECVPAIEDVIAAGISVNVTLIFSDPRYEEVAEAYIAGLERAKGDLSKISSVASFFVSRVDTLVDKKLEALGTDEAKALLGKAAVAQSKLAYVIFNRVFSGPRWEALEKRGARKQRLLWASTGVKNPKYPDTLYIDSLIGPDTVNTMPDAAVAAFHDHGKVARTIDSNVDEALTIYNKVEELGIKWDDTKTQLEEEGVASFKQSFEDLLAELSRKASALVN